VQTLITVCGIHEILEMKMKKIASFLVCAFACCSLMASTGCPAPDKPGAEQKDAPKHPPSDRANPDWKPGSAPDNAKK